MTANGIIPAVHTNKKHVAVSGAKTVVHIGFWKLCTAVVHVDTEKYWRLLNSAAHTCKLNLEDNTSWNCV